MDRPADRTNELSSGVVVAGWILVALSAVFLPLAIAAVAIGVVAMTRGRVALGVAMVSGAVVVVVAVVYLASATLVPRT